MAKGKMNPLQIVLGIVFAAAGMTYLFMGLDLIPDTYLLVVGFLDDAVVMLLLWWIFKKSKKWIKKVKLPK